MKKILIFYDFFSPAFKAGGPIRSINNLVHLIHHEAEIYVYTAAVDLDNSPLQVEQNKWTPFLENVNVFYASKDHLNIPTIYKTLNAVQPTTVYINGLFTPYAVLFPLISVKLFQRKNPSVKVVLAPRGMLQKGALALKARKKSSYLKIFKLLRLQKGLHWHATDQQEWEDIKSFAGSNAVVEVISNVPILPLKNHSLPKLTDVLRLITISLVAQKKNHHFVLQCLKGLPSNYNVTYDIYGPIKDVEYWQLLEREIQKLPSHIHVTYKGAILPEQVTQTLQPYDCFMLPTLGENFGHAIFEALGVGMPVLISDQTPWRNLEEEKAGWDLPLEEHLWVDKLTEICKMNNENFQPWRSGAYNYTIAHLKKENLKEQYLGQFGIE